MQLLGPPHSPPPTLTGCNVRFHFVTLNNSNHVVSSNTIVRKLLGIFESFDGMIHNY